ncbi:thymidine kinase [Paenibacillus sp. J5C_2022]|uniref:thymidine kinase n=1 Tax=Paenibacillus sp. J5C2022 TaxID=2977129 RepID=UPI0021D3D2C8|nr:thymidine kinase [Paenibacillus sp. J5C2022]MCU6712878.1 thymidine kinase [Paenibacillus sp. J5C2022]
MAQLYYKYGTMNSGKSFEIIKVAHNYEEQGKPVLIYSPAISARESTKRIGSRAGFQRKAIPVYEETDLFRSVNAHIAVAVESSIHRSHIAEAGESVIHRSENAETGGKSIYCVLIDEAQFLSKQQVLQLTHVVDELNIPVMAFGLKNDFQNRLFEGSYYLLAQADKIEEIKTICWYCDRKATMVLRYRNGVPVNTGDQIQIGGNEDYKPVCRRCYNDAFNS